MVCAYPENKEIYAFLTDGPAHRQYFTVENGEAAFRAGYSNLKPEPYSEYFYLLVPTTVRVILPMKTPEVKALGPVLIYKDSFCVGPWP